MIIIVVVCFTIAEHHKKAKQPPSPKTAEEEVEKQIPAEEESVPAEEVGTPSHQDKDRKLQPEKEENSTLESVMNLFSAKVRSRIVFNVLKMQRM